MNSLDPKRHLKVIIIDPEGNVFPYYVDDFDLKHNDLSHFTIFEHIGKQEKRIPKKILRQVRKAAHENLYLDIINVFHRFNYSIFLDTTNYNNYHDKKLHTGNWLMSHAFSKLSLLQQRSFAQLFKMMPENVLEGEGISYAEVNVDYLNQGKIVHTDRNEYIGVLKNEKKMK